MKSKEEEKFMKQWERLAEQVKDKPRRFQRRAFLELKRKAKRFTK